MVTGTATDCSKEKMNTNTMKTRLRSLPSLQGPFNEIEMDKLPDTPQEAFQQWLDEAIAAGIKEPHAMTLSTVDPDGFPDARVLILKMWTRAVGTSLSRQAARKAGNWLPTRGRR